MNLRNASIVSVAILLATACGGAASDESGPDATTATIAAVNGTTAAPTTTTAEPSDSATASTTTPTTTTAPATPTTTTSTTTPTTTTSTTTPTTTTSTTTPTTTTSTTTDAEGLGDSFYPFLGNGGYDVLHYNITINVNTDANEMSALTHITARAAEDLEEFNLDLSGLDVVAVAVANPDGSEAVDAEFTRTGTELTIQPGRLLAAGTVFTASVLYTGWPEPLDHPGVTFFKLGWQRQGDVIFTASEPSGSMTWFPSNNHPADKATFRIEITVPEGLTAASNGLLVAESTSGGHHHVHVADGRPDVPVSGGRVHRRLRADRLRAAR